MTTTTEKNMLSIADSSGDTRIMWDPREKDEVRIAKQAFEQARGKGMLAYTVRNDGSKGEVIREFDKTQAKIIMTKQLQGG